jgi:hypothetical protein
MAKFKFKTHNDDPAIADLRMGTGLRGYITITYDELIEAFGSPGEGDPYKVDAKWIVVFPGDVVATIYNYKNGKNYIGANGKSVQDMIDWHIGGGDSDKVLAWMNKLFPDHKLEGLFSDGKRTLISPAVEKFNEK